jgi:hypothetical protein
MAKESTLNNHPKANRLYRKLLEEFVSNIDHIDLYERTKPRHSGPQDLGFLSLLGVFKNSGYRMVADDDQKAEFPSNEASTSQPSGSQSSSSK